MADVLRSPQANEDLLEIWKYIARDNPTAADGVLETIDKKCQLLASHPKMGQKRQELAPGLFCFPISRYVIFFGRSKTALRSLA